jgi:hypothetical protein
LPRSPGERLKIVDAIIEDQTATRSLDDDPEISQVGRDAFGTFWKVRNPIRRDWPPS